MITEKSRPVGGGLPDNFAGQEFTGSLIGPSNVGQGECAICGMATSNGEQVHRGCDDAAALAKVADSPAAQPTRNLVAGSVADSPMTDAEIWRALNIARDLIRAGVPVFAAPPDPSSSIGFKPPTGWQSCAPDLAEVDKWRPGWALCAVGGHALDVLDTDPRNFHDGHGNFIGDGATELRDAGEWPVSYGQASTPSGGTHDLIAPLGVGKGVPAQGVDLQGGKPDGTGRGFVFISPTVKKSKVDGVARPYRWTVEPGLSRLAVEGPADTSGQGVARRITDKRSKPAVPEVPRQASSPAYGLPGALPARDVGDRVTELCDELASAPAGGGGNYTAARISFMVGQYVGAGQLTAWEAESRLTGALAGWTYAQAGDEAAMRYTIGRGIAAGAKSPREYEPARHTTTDQWRDLVRPEGGEPHDGQGVEWETAGEPESLFIDVAKLLTEGIPPPPKPVLLTREDGHALFYAEKVNVLFGDPECGKTWIALAAIVEAVNAGRRAAFIDLDHNGAGEILSRLLILGAKRAALSDPDCFRLSEPESAEELILIVAALKAWRPAAVVVDSLGELVPMLGLNSSNPDDYTSAHRRTLTPLANSGAAVIAIDHLPKSDESRDRGQTGTMAKKRAVNGVLLRVTVAEQFAPGRGGAASMSIEKDRPGGVRAHSPLNGKNQPAGRFVMSVDLAGTVTWRVTQPKVTSGDDTASDRDIAELDGLDPPPSSKRDVQNRLKWGSDRAQKALTRWRDLCGQGE